MAVISSRVHCNLLGLLTALLVQGVVGDLRGVGQEGDHCVEQGLDPLVLQGAAHEHREELALQAGTPDPRLQAPLFYLPCNGLALAYVGCTLFCCLGIR
uniref:Secreted protein n=1 Tax=Ixodes ricinus TaxID=34613 RepID=A0A6B0U838_IXORI